MTDKPKTTLRRYGIVGYNPVELKDGAYIHVEDLLAWLRYLTEHDDRDVMIDKISDLEEQLNA